MLFLLVLTVGVASQDICPGFCPATCINEVVECPENYTLAPGGASCGCCPGCVKYLESCRSDLPVAVNGRQNHENHTTTPCCDEKDEVCANTTLPCKPGCKCVEDFCKEGPCTKKQENHCVSWTPRCTLNGDFAPVQCKGEKPTGRCYCVDPNGKRIFGEQWWSKADSMSCACSRRVWELMQAGRKTVTLHCTQEGNFEELQCDEDLCWCADEMTGEPMSVVVPDFMMQTLSCYNISEVGTSYLRKCESQKYAQERIAMEMAAHGTMNATFPPINCEWDGSFGAVQKTDDDIIRCTWKNNTNIRSWSAENTVINVELMNCNCARDYIWYQLIGRPFISKCNSYGNYETMQGIGDSKYCVDSDGFRCSEVQGSKCDSIP